jgi:hypothetical protein
MSGIALPATRAAAEMHSVAMNVERDFIVFDMRNVVSGRSLVK